ncbi:MAG: site-specific DNA-methyltransferase, partial [Candidatus Micrarchaeaceae archaeon]
DEFMYKDKYQHSSWLTMMENRLSLARELMSEDGVIFVSIDDNEMTKLDIIIKDKFKFLANIIWRKLHTVKNDAKNFSINTEYILCYTKSMNEKEIIKPIKFEKTKDYKYKDEKGLYKLDPLHAKSGTEASIYEYTFKNGIKWKPPAGTYPRYSIETLREFENSRKIVFPNTEIITVDGRKVKYRGTMPMVKRYLSEVYEGKKVESLWDGKEVGFNKDTTLEFENLFKDFGRKIKSELNPKPICLLKKCVEISTENNDIVLDFFAGSGTTAHAVMKLNKEDNGKRKFILIEMADYFDTVIIPRIKKVAYSFNWKNGKPQDNDGIGIFCKYNQLEQFEDILSVRKYDEKECENKKQFKDSIFMFDKKLLSCVNTKEDKVKVSFENIYSNTDIDWIDSISLSNGLQIKEIRQEYVLFSNKMKIKKDDIDINLVKNLIFWE